MNNEKYPLVYIATPYSSDPVRNTQNAIAVAEMLEQEHRVYVVVPHLTHLWDLISPAPHEKWLERDIAVMRRCDAVVRFPGASKGADLEVEYAKAAGIPVFIWGDKREEIAFGAWRDRIG